MTAETYDGLCGIIPTFASSDLQLRCHYELGHHGPCSWQKYKSQFMIIAGTFYTLDPERDFINSVLFHKK